MKVIPVGDLHAPYHDKEAVKAILAHIRKERPHVVIQVGDLLDQYVFSKYPRSSKISVEQDIKEGLKAAADFWKRVKKIVPRAKCYQVFGNHDLRLSKRIKEGLPELLEVYNPLSMYRFEGVINLKDDRDHLEIDGVIYTHGHLSSSIAHVNHYKKPVVHGHLHKASITSQGSLWSMDCGYLADPSQLPLQYGASRLHNWARGLAVVEDGVPRIKLVKP